MNNWSHLASSTNPTTTYAIPLIINPPFPLNGIHSVGSVTVRCSGFINIFIACSLTQSLSVYDVICLNYNNDNMQTRSHFIMQISQAD